MKIMKCDARAFARCPDKKQCSDSPEHTSFYEGTECDYFNQQVIHAPLTNADRIRAMSDEELSDIFLRADFCKYCEHEKDGVCNYICAYPNIPLYDGCKRAALTWLQQPAEEDT